MKQKEFIKVVQIGDIVMVYGTSFEHPIPCVVMTKTNFACNLYTVKQIKGDDGVIRPEGSYYRSYEEIVECLGASRGLYDYYKKSNTKNMEINKQWKRVPFDIELAKKIQSGEVEGRIVICLSSGEYAARVLALNIRNAFKHVFLAVDNDGKEEVVTFDGINTEVCSVFIELPEETSKQNFETVAESNAYHDGYENGYNAGKSETPKHEFKVGDVVKVTPQDSKHSEWIIGFGPVIARVLCQTSEGVLLENKGGFIDMFSLDEIQFITDASHDSNHKFKPFDRVLVRDDDKDEWQISFFSHMKDDWFITNNGHMYRQCIPYDGNEDLVGTTNKPKED